jgi:hypothetical protein
MEISNELKVTEPTVIVITPVSNEIDPVEPDVNVIPASNARRSEPPKDDVSQKTREAIEEAGRRSGARNFEKKQVERDEAGQKALERQMELRHTTLSYPA